MLCKLNPAWALRGWLRAPYILYHLASGDMCYLSRDSFQLLCACDGQTDLLGSAALDSFLQRGIVTPCAEAEALAPEQCYQFHWNHHFQAVEWSITNRCNYRCKHCFIAPDGEPLRDEISYGDCLAIIDQLVGAGVGEVWLTGGEPLLHPRFLDIARAIRQSGLRLTRIMTNGSLLTDELLDALDALGIRPIFSISFDGSGAHDWMRGVLGAEEQALEAIRRAKARGFQVRIHLCVHRGNAHVLKDSLAALSEMRVDLFRVIRTAESPRWQQNAMALTLPPEEYYEIALSLFDWHRNSATQVPLWVWGVGYADHRQPREQLLTHEEVGGAPLDEMPICSCARAMFFLSGDGSVSVCNQLSGVMRAKGDDWGNLNRTTLQQILSESPLMDRVLYTVADFLRDNPQCAECSWHPLCRGGCRAFPYGLESNYFGPDKTKCVFYRGGYYDRLQSMLRTS